MVKVGDTITYMPVSLKQKDDDGFDTQRKGTVVNIPEHHRFAVVDFGGWRECVPLMDGEVFLTKDDIDTEARREKLKLIPKEIRSQRAKEKRARWLAKKAMEGKNA